MKSVQGRTLVILISLLLILSLSLNAYFWYQINDGKTASNSHKDKSGVVSNSENPPLNDQIESLNPQPESSEVGLSSDEPIEIKQLYEFLREENWPALTVAVRAFLKSSPDNIDAQLIEAELIARTEPLSIALVHYYSLLDLALNAEQRKVITQKIDQLFENATEQLRFDRAWNLLAELLEPLVQIAPDERRYLILLAEAYAQQINAVMMENALAGLERDDPAIESIRSILLRKQSSDDDSEDPEIAASEGFDSDSNSRNVTRIQLERLGNQYTVETGIDGRPVRLMIDTGASTTAITTRAWSRLSGRIASQFIGVFKVNTAAGFIEAPMFKVKSFTMGSLSFDDISVMIIPSRMMGDDPRLTPQGLLGMNILSNYNFQIDQQSAQLLLSPRTR